MRARDVRQRGDIEWDAVDLALQRTADLVELLQHAGEALVRRGGRPVLAAIPDLVGEAVAGVKEAQQGRVRVDLEQCRRRPRRGRGGRERVAEIFSVGPQAIGEAAGPLGRGRVHGAAAAIAERVERFGPAWQHVGPLTVGGHPRHPSRLSYAWRFAPFDVAAYLEEIHGSATASGLDAAAAESRNLRPFRQ